jgi:hypothetical protein
MTHDDSVQIAATSPARRLALARVRRGDDASGVARKWGSRCGGIGNYPPCKGKGSRTPKWEKNPNSRAARQSFEPARFGRGIEAREGWTAKRSRPEMAPQPLDKIESALGNGMASAASNPQHLVRGRAAGRARLRLTSPENDQISVLGKLQKKAPNPLKSLDAELKSAPALGIFFARRREAASADESGWA